MPKVIIDPTKGLHQVSGTTVEVKSAGVAGVAYSDTESLSSVGATNGSISLPAGALIQDIGLVFVTECKTANNGATDVLSLRLGTDSDGSGEQLVAETSVLAQNDAGLAGTAQWTSQANKANASSTAIALADAAVLYSSTARSIYYRLEVETSALATAGTAKVAVNFVIIE